MKHALALYTVLSLVGPASASEALTITDPVQAPTETCTLDLSGFFAAPPELLDCNDPNCGRLAPALRSAAQTRDAREILLRSAVEYYAVRHPEMRPGTTSSLAL